MLKQRVITALLLLPVAFLLLVRPPDEFLMLLIPVIGLLAWEWAGLSEITRPLGRLAYSVLVMGIIGVLWALSPVVEFWPAPLWPGKWEMSAPLAILIASWCVWLLGWILVILYPRAQGIWARGFAVRALAGLILLPGAFVALVSLRALQYLPEPLHGAWVLLFMLVIIWAADIGAYFAGKTLGKHKLAPSVSPGKTWEGAIGGAILALVVASVGIWLMGWPVANKAIFAAVVILLVIISVFGDLFESMCKRKAGIKDSSQILPGHGGLLDRLDSTIAVAPFFLLALKLGGLA